MPRIAWGFRTRSAHYTGSVVRPLHIERPQDSQEGLPMSAEDNKAMVRRVIDELWNQRNLSLFAELFGPETRAVTTEQHRQNAREMEQSARVYGTAFPDLQMAIDDL